MGKPTLIGSFIGQFPDLRVVNDEGDVSDFRQVPESDMGNAGYSDVGQFGSFGPSNREQYRNPDGVVMFDGYGASKDDIGLGFIRPTIRENPAYDKVNYSDRSSEPKVPDDDLGNPNAMDQDWAFRSRNREARGFITRPRLPKER